VEQKLAASTQKKRKGEHNQYRISKPSTHIRHEETNPLQGFWFRVQPFLVSFGRCKFENTTVMQKLANIVDNNATSLLNGLEQRSKRR
jgi:hypothetical protein